MLRLSGEGIEGKEMTFGEALKRLRPLRFELGGGWEYDGGYLDRLLARVGESDYYIRLPIAVVAGALDAPAARIRFGTPFLLRHVLQHGVGPMPAHPFFDAQGLSAMWNQFQPPKDPDAPIDEDRWREASEAVVLKVREALAGAPVAG
ncbi:MAG: YugN-like family protein [Hydrogenibacillus schlegelii]|uniref:YugN-like family protein n=1 Tax=Hydrogenibacillus schlegelii TaxID=1484 RepID=A0A947D3V0_HYDSH|nr:YugN-like family protein [Hydrogenibacillus schlegelii]